MKTWLIPVVVIAGLLPAQAMAGRMNYAFIQATHVPDMDMSGAVERDGDGWGTRFGFIMGPYAFADARFEDIDFDGKLDSQETHARIGARLPVINNSETGNRLDVYGLVSYEDLDIDSLIDESGTGATLGWRWGPVDWFELALEANFVDYGRQDARGVTMDLHLNAGPVVAFVFGLRRHVVDLDIPGLADLERDNFSAGFRFRFGGE